jgi:hypothetical protein
MAFSALKLIFMALFMSLLAMPCVAATDHPSASDHWTASPVAVTKPESAHSGKQGKKSRNIRKRCGSKKVDYESSQKQGLAMTEEEAKIMGERNKVAGGRDKQRTVQRARQKPMTAYDKAIKSAHEYIASGSKAK